MESRDVKEKHHIKEGLEIFFEARKINPTVPKCFDPDTLGLMKFIDDLLVEKNQIISEKETKILELTYAPGGPGYQQAKADFEFYRTL